MLLTVLGCSGSVPGPNAAASGYLVEADGARLVVDLGNGTLAALQGAGRDPFDVDAMLFSHLHPDHCADFSALTVLRRYHPDPPYDATRRRLPVYAPTEAPTRFAAAYAPDAAELADTELSDVYSFQPWKSGKTVDIAGFSVTVESVAHPCDAYGLRISRAGRTLCYTGDSGPCEALLRLAEGADCLLAESSWTDSPSRPPDLHLSGLQAGELAARAGVGRLLVTHVPPWTDSAAVFAEARAAFGGDTVLVTQGAGYPV